MRWNLNGLALLYPPDVFTGTFDNEKMEQRHQQLVEKKREDILSTIAKEENPFKAMATLHRKDRLQFLLNNSALFQSSGVYEEALLHLYRYHNAPFSSGGDLSLWYSLFEACSGERLDKLGKPPPFQETLIFRGSVTGCKRSLSWTPERKAAERMARRWHDPALGGGEIYEVDIGRKDILLYISKSNQEDEVIVAPHFIITADIRSFRR